VKPVYSAGRDPEELLRGRKAIRSVFQSSQVRTFRELYGKRKKSLEVGCGYGFFTSLALETTDRLCCVDTEDYLAPSVKASPNVEFKAASALKLPYSDGQFDCVFSMDVIEHVEDGAAFLAENLRVLKKSGTLILGTPNRNRLSAFIRKMLFMPNRYPLVIKDRIFGTITHVREYSLKELSDLLKSFPGLKIEKFKPVYFGLTDPVNIGVPRPPFLFVDLCQFWLVSLVKTGP